jgi:hypothetical protein
MFFDATPYLTDNIDAFQSMVDPNTAPTPLSVAAAQ